MEYVQERVTTLHDLATPVPETPVSEAAVVVPLTEREHAGLAADRTLSTLAALDPARVVVPLRAGADRVAEIHGWLRGYDLPLETLWCDGPRLEATLADAGLDGDRGKGRDVWLAIGNAAAGAEYVVVHDADATTYSEAHVPRLLFPVANGYTFAKGYYARVESNRLYGRLFRLLYAPLVRALADASDAPVVDYLGSFRYALAGEFAATADLARRLRPPRGWGLEVATLGDAFDAAGFAGSAQVDLGVHEHDHRSVSGPSGLSEMAVEVTAVLFDLLERHGVDPDHATLPECYRTAADAFVDAYAADAAFNGLEYDPPSERDQVATYADAVESAGDRSVDRLPAWTDASLSPKAVRAAAREDLSAATNGEVDDP